MRITLNEDQIDVLLNGLDELVGSADRENEWTDDEDIHESNDAKIAEADALYRYLSEFKNRKNLNFLFSDRKRLAEMFDAWAEENGVAKTPENVVVDASKIKRKG